MEGILVARLTKTDLERKLLTGMSVSWDDGSKRKLLLSDPKARGLFKFLLVSSVRNPVGLPEAFIQGLRTAYESGDDPATRIGASPSPVVNATRWKLNAMETEGFGGLNTWNGPDFRFEFDQESLLLEGPNGSGKSSLVAAILWALTGERPRAQADEPAHQTKPVFDSCDKPPVGQWPPIACYPSSAADLAVQPKVRVQLKFVDEHGKTAVIERILENGVINCNIDPQFDIPSVFLETGLLMPSRLSVLRLRGETRLTDAVQKLTGLDDLVAIGELVEGLCHKSREYLSYCKKDLAAEKKKFENGIQAARDALAAVEVPVPNFAASDTNDKNSEMGKFGKQLAEKATELTNVIASDLGSQLALGSAAVQNQVISAIGAAEEDLRAGLSSLDSWDLLASLDRDLDAACITRLKETISVARADARETAEFARRNISDSKFQLKALAARWHAQNCAGEIQNCPLCEHKLDPSGNLVKELQELRSAGSLAASAFDDSVNSILSNLNRSLPASQTQIGEELLTWEPRKQLIIDLRAAFIEKERYSKILVRFKTLVEGRLQQVPATELPAAAPVGEGILKPIEQRITIIERAIDLVDWYRSTSATWLSWWEDTTATISAFQAVAGKITASSPKATTYEGLSAHLTRLSDAIAKAKPYGNAAESMRTAWTAGKEIVKIETVLELRKKIAETIEPLKQLVPLAQSVASEAIEDLSSRIEKLLSRIYLTEQLQYHDAQLSKKEGVVVYGDLGNALRIDATLIANTSWLRAVLWAFTFALREEAVERFGRDVFPLLVFDDPQATFDSAHRHRWAQYVSSLQNGPSSVQLVLATYEEMFLELIKIDGVKGRQAMIAAAGPELGHVGIFEGESLERQWQKAQAEKTPQAGRDYMIAVRIYLEGLLRLMLRAEDPNVSSFVIGDSREKLRQLHESDIAPWNKSEFKKLCDVLGKGKPEIKFTEMVHHTGGQNLGMGEATDVEKYWRVTLNPALHRCFSIHREHLQLHGGMKALHAPPALVSLPEGYKSKVAEIPLRIIGKAAALSDGRTADGRLDMDEYASAAHKKITLARHAAYRLTAATLEPVARPGDMLLVKDAGEPSVKSLVVAIREDQVLARRFEVAENHSDIAVLTAQAINPRKIAPPVIAQKSTFTLHKIIGVLYEESGWNAPIKSDMEICECSGEAAFSGLIANALGLVEVVGQSAEPHALHGQYIIVGKQLPALEAMNKLDGKPVIASDSDDNRYFKRLRVGQDRVVLESMDSGGDYAPIILSMPGQQGHCLESVWPVAGVLFELPN
jgi:energy-coupling factor transporter ATP-binding protein EcfA2